jgi:hypothetical protein
MTDGHPLFSEQGDHVDAELSSILEATQTLTIDEVDNVVQVVAASYQKALQLRYVVEGLLAISPDERARLADGLESVDELLGTLATWHATTRDKLFYAAQRLRAGE